MSAPGMPSGRQRGRIITATCHVLSKQFGGLRPNGRFRRLEVRQDVPEILGESAGVVSGNDEGANIAQQAVIFAWGRKLGLPDSGKVRLATGGARRGRGEVRFTVARARSMRVRIVQPLRIGARERPGKHDSDHYASIAHVSHITAVSE